jgi:hypothetical protein
LIGLKLDCFYFKNGMVSGYLYVLLLVVDTAASSIRTNSVIFINAKRSKAIAPTVIGKVKSCQ